MKISVLLPSYMRPQLMLNCLGAIERQSRAPDEVVVVLRDTDAASQEALGEFSSRTRLPLKTVSVSRPGQIPALNTGLEAVTGDIVCITDDDAEPFPDWVERYERWFESDPGLGGVGGRDHVHRDGVPVPSRRVGTIGKVQWFGRFIGNHSQDSDGPRQVDHLKGCNMAYRVSVRPRFDERLRGDAYQNEAALCLGVAARGKRILYDPAIRVNHFLGERHFGSEREGLAPQRLFNNSFNGMLVRLPYFGRGRALLYVLYSLFIGDTATPGLLKAIQLARGAPAKTLRILAPSLQGKLAGLRAARDPAPPAP